MTRSSRTRQPLRWRLEIWRRRVIVGSFAPETIYSIDMSELRASAATFAWAGDTFTVRRAEAMSEDIHDRLRWPS